MTIMTVNGPIDAADLGVTLPHEHIFSDTSGDHVEPPPAIRELAASLGVDLEAPIALSTVGFLWREPQWSKDNQILVDYGDARDELAIARRVGIDAIIETNTLDLGSRPASLRRLGEELGLHLITGTGYYRQKFHPPEVADMTVEQLEERFLRDLLEGFDGTDIRAGVIGELGTSGDTIFPDERRVLVAAARAQARTGVLTYVHTSGRRDTVLEAISVLTENGADPGKIHICHVNEAPWWREVVDRGPTIGLDCFGSTFSIDSEVAINPSDGPRIEQLQRIFDAGCGDRVLASNDICMKMRLHKYGGWGYDHIQTNLYPHLRRAGLTEADLHTLFVETPRRLLDVPA